MSLLPCHQRGRLPSYSIMTRQAHRSHSVSCLAFRSSWTPAAAISESHRHTEREIHGCLLANDGDILSRRSDVIFLEILARLVPLFAWLPGYPLDTAMKLGMRSTTRWTSRSRGQPITLLPRWHTPLTSCSNDVVKQRRNTTITLEAADMFQITSTGDFRGSCRQSPSSSEEVYCSRCLSPKHFLVICTVRLYK
jgi:hypothetical protein